MWDSTKGKLDQYIIQIWKKRDERRQKGKEKIGHDRGENTGSHNNLRWLFSVSAVDLSF